MASSGGSGEQRWQPEWADRDPRFICVASQGGKYADADFAAGYFVGGMIEKLRVASVSGTVPLEVAVPIDLVQQIDLVAMKFGFVVEVDWDSQYYQYVPIAFRWGTDVTEVMEKEQEQEDNEDEG